MKLLSVLTTTVLSSHYRGGSYIFTSNADGTTSIQHTQTWRDGAAGIGSYGMTTCVKAHEGTLARPWPDLITNCRLLDQGRTNCPTPDLKWPYIVGFSSNREMGGMNDYCYGSYVQNMPTPSAAYRIGWSGVAWVDMTDDRGVKKQFNDGKMEVYATIKVPNNNSPVFTHPPLWRIMSGCDGQKMDLKPVDPDGDRVKCRWAKSTAEGGAATYDAAAWPSLSLDEDNCIVTYTGSMDNTHTGVKGVGIMMEDFDANNEIKSSIPVQFLAAVWTPQTVSRGVALPFVYPDWFAETEGDHHDDLGDHHKPSKKEKNKGKNRGRRTTTPSYCSAAPEAEAPTPPDGAVIEQSGGSFEITLKARSSNGYIKSYSFEKPALMTCTNPDSNGSCTCTWTPNRADRQTRDHGFCFLATDSLGLTSERRCVTLRVPPNPSCQPGFVDQGDGTCADINECSASNLNDCHQLATCMNTNGGYTCKCNDGYGGDGRTCADINECSASNLNNCHQNAKCTNINGGFNCACESGYRGDGVTCSEINECNERSHNCHHAAECSNTPGSFTCTCNDGYRGNGVSCNDINECSAGTDNCDTNAKCSNTIGSFTCACHDGYRGDGVTCLDIDECAEEKDNCNEYATCSNTPGSFTCACLSGYRGDGVKCEEIDECAEGIHACDINAECDNTPGAYDCTCNIGWEGNGFSCVDIDECATGAHACHSFGTCTNTAGSYDCTCNDGYMGDGFLCTVPCATFYDTGKDGYLTNTSAFTTGTFAVTNLETFETTPSQDGISNWKMNSSFNNKASFVAVKEKCTLEGFTGNNFGGKKLGKWNGTLFLNFI